MTVVEVVGERKPGVILLLVGETVEEDDSADVVLSNSVEDGIGEWAVMDTEDDEAVTPVVDVDVVLASTEELAASSIVTLTEDTDVSDAEMLGVSSNVVLTTDSVCGDVRTARRVDSTLTVVEDVGEVGKRAPVAEVVVVVVVAVVVAVVGLLRVEVGS